MSSKPPGPGPGTMPPSPANPPGSTGTSTKPPVPKPGWPGGTMPPTLLPPKQRKSNVESTRETLANWGKEKPAEKAEEKKEEGK